MMKFVKILSDEDYKIILKALKEKKFRLLKKNKDVEKIDEIHDKIILMYYDRKYTKEYGDWPYLRKRRSAKMT
jgi:hypothetical protein